MDKKHNEICENLIPTKLQSSGTIQNLTTPQNTNILYNWLACSAVKNVRNNGYTSLYVLIRMHY